MLGELRESTKKKGILQATQKKTSKKNRKNIDQFLRIIGFNPRLIAQSSQNQITGGSPAFQKMQASH